MTDTALATRADFDTLVADLTAAAAAYYGSDADLMTDAAYDAALDQVQAALDANPEWSTPEAAALVGEVAGGTSAGGDVVHPERMLSLAKISPDKSDDAEIRILLADERRKAKDESPITQADVEAFKDRNKTEAASLVTKTNKGVVVEPKMDGLAVRVEYVEGRLMLAALRGNGDSGENVTEQVRRGIVGLPLVLDEPFTGEVRGEVYMPEAQFAAAQTLRVQRGGQAFVNPRNAVSGCLRKSGDENAMPMSFAAYDLSSPLTSHYDRMAEAQGLGFATALGTVEARGVDLSRVTTVEEAVALIKAIEALRPTLGFEIDGAVIKADSDWDRTALGEGSRTPYWAIAYKYPPQVGESRIVDVEVRTGRTGRISLRARIEPVFVGGTTIRFASMHSPSWVETQGIGIGSKVRVERRGDVIPRVEAPLDPSVNEGIPTWVAPETCPTCDEAWDKTSLLWRCHTPACSVAGRLTYALGGDALDVDGFGSSIAEALAENAVAKDIADLFTLTLDEWATLQIGTTAAGAPRLLGETVAKKIMANIEAAKNQPFNRVITALGIRHGGKSVGRWLAAEFHTMDNLRAASVADLAQIDKMGEIKATAIVNGLADMADVIDRLAAAGVNMGAMPVDDGSPKPLAGMTVVISGAVPAGYKNRPAAQEAIVAAGGKASGSVSKTTTFLVTDETTTSKAVKAKSLGVPVIDPDVFDALLEGRVVIEADGTYTVKRA